MAGFELVTLMHEPIRQTTLSMKIGLPFKSLSVLFFTQELSYPYIRIAYFYSFEFIMFDTKQSNGSSFTQMSLGPNFGVIYDSVR